MEQVDARALTDGPSQGMVVRVKALAERRQERLHVRLRQGHDEVDVQRRPRLTAHGTGERASHDVGHAASRCSSCRVRRPRLIVVVVLEHLSAIALSSVWAGEFHHDFARSTLSSSMTMTR